MSALRDEVAKLIEEVGDARAKAALKALNDRIDEMSRAVGDRDRALRRYFFDRDGLHYDVHAAQLEGRLLDNRRLKNRSLRTQVEADNVVLLQARANDDFPEFCRRAALIVEACTADYMRWLARNKTLVFNDIWTKQQLSRSSRYSSHKPKLPNPDLRGADLSDLAEMSFMSSIGLDFLKKSDVKNYYFIIQDIRKIRNNASHRDGLGLTDFSELSQNDSVRILYEDRLVSGYGRTEKALQFLVAALDKSVSGTA